MKKTKITKRQWSDNDILEWANIYVDTCKPLTILEKELKVSHSTMHWCFIHRLPYIDSDLYDKVLEMIEIHRRIR